MAKDGQGGAPACEECDPILWWPEAAPTDIALSSLPAAGAISNPLRLPGRAPWLGLWGEYAGLRVGITGTGQSYPARSGSAFPYPQLSKEMGRGQIDLYLSADTGFWGTVTVARFWTREAALAWGGQNSYARTGTSPLGPFPAASALNDADPNPTTTRVGANQLVWDIVNALWVRAEAKVPAFNLAESGKPIAESLGLSHLWDSTKLTWGRAAMVRNSGGAANGGRAVVEDGYLDQTVLLNNVSTASTGIKASYTVPSNRIAKVYCPNFSMRSASAGVIVAAQIVRGGNTNGLGAGTSTATIGGATPVTPFGGPYTLQASDTFQLNVTTLIAASSADFYIGVEERDAQ